MPQMRDYTAKLFRQAHNTTFDFPTNYMVHKATEESVLGGGAYGVVVKISGRKRDGTETIMAVKKFTDPFSFHIKAQRCYREIKILQQLDHRSIVKVVDLYTPDEYPDDLQRVYLVTKYSGCTIHQYMQEQIKNRAVMLQLIHIKIIIYETVCALNYLYSAGIVHRDLSPSNITLTESTHPDGPNKVTLIDFGLARVTDSSMTTYVCTRNYRAPEINWWKIGTYDHKADMWSLGCILGELIIWKKLFPSSKTVDILHVQMDLCGPIDSEMLERRASTGTRKTLMELSKDKMRQDFYRYFTQWNQTTEQLDGHVIDFLENTLQFDPDKRIELDAALAHPFLADVREREFETKAARMIDNDDATQRETREWKHLIWNEINNFRPNELTPI